MGVFIFIVIVICILGICVLVNENEKLNNAYRSGDPDKIKFAEDSHNMMVYGKGFNIKCPNCGRLHVNYLSTANRATSVAMFGLASGKIGKTYECPNCKYKW